MTWPNDSRTAGAVTRSIFDPGTGWSLVEARELLGQGYSAQHVSKVTGYPVAMLAPGVRVAVR